jgi:predicted HAD superfamily Cof-like phosphohydrolase
MPSSRHDSSEPSNAGDFPGMGPAAAHFHAAFGLALSDEPTLDVSPDVAELRVRLLAEEFDEYVTAVKNGDLVAIADALADIVYVAYGSAVTYGIDLDAVLAEVHRANMSKLDADGKPVLRDDGKVMKSPLYTPPDVAGVLRRQARRA